MNEREIEVADYVSPSRLADFVINPYVGCPHACRYCYAADISRVKGRVEIWGDFLDVKRCRKSLGAKRLTGKSVFMSSVTDCYNPAEARYKITRRILEELAPIECRLSITTKSNLLLRDLDLLKARTSLFGRPKSLFDLGEDEDRAIRVSCSINTVDEGFRADMDRASTIEERMETLEVCREAGIPTLLFAAPLFPYISDFRAIVERSASFVDVFWFDKLNMRPTFKDDLLTYVRARYPEYYRAYLAIFERGDESYWRDLSEEISDFCDRKGVSYEVFF
ncbi:MAG: radical SAM protein [Thermoguttaceae bacterium]|nr:radical SAM protein [Thermoguttaceae bacterium]